MSGTGWRPTGTECCVVRGRPRLRSVHREFTGRAIELRNHFVLAEADAVIRAEGETGALQRLGAEALSESKNAACEQGIPRNLGGPAVSRSEAGGATRKKPGRVLAAPCRHESEEVGAGSTGVRRERRNAGTDGRKSELFVVPMKQGNQPEGPCGGKGEPSRRTVGGKDEGNLCPEVSQQNCNG